MIYSQDEFVLPRLNRYLTQLLIILNNGLPMMYIETCVEFHFDSNGPVPSGIGQTRAVPVYLSLTRKLGKDFRVDLFGGAVFGGNLRLEDRNGNRIDSVSYSTAPLLGMALSSAF